MPKGLACWHAMSGLVARAFIIILLDNEVDVMLSAPSELKKNALGNASLIIPKF
jgi:hypothetical protein